MAAVATILGKRVDIELLCRWRRGCRQHIVVAADDGGAAAENAAADAVTNAVFVLAAAASFLLLLYCIILALIQRYQKRFQKRHFCARMFFSNLKDSIIGS